MATIRKRGAHQWEAQIRRRGYPAQSKTFNTKAEAEAWSQMIESEMARGVWISRGEAETTSLLEALTRYEREVTPAKKGAEPEAAVLRILRRTSLARRSMASIRSSDVAKLRDDWLRDRAPATVLRRLQVLSHVFNIARKEWGMEGLSNPVELVRKPQPLNARSRRILATATNPGDNNTDISRHATDSELEHIVKASRSSVLPAIIWLAVETAMRRSEIVELRWEHIDLDSRVAHLPDTKNGNSRDVPLSPRAITILRSLSSEPGPSHSEGTVSDVCGDSRVFKIRGDAVTRAFERALDRAHRLYLDDCEMRGYKPNPKYLTDLRFHDLRHEATSRLAEVFPMHELTKITGHKDPRMLMRYYHPRAEELAKKLS